MNKDLLHLVVCGNNDQFLFKAVECCGIEFSNFTGLFLIMHIEGYFILK